MEFTPEQKHIFQFIEQEDGHGIIDAVAGAGKTTTIMECARFVKDKRNVLFCAFNNSIAREIARKFYQRGMNEVAVKTIHALGRQILKSNNQTGRPIRLENRKYRELLRSPEIQEKLQPIYLRICQLNKLDPENIYDDRQKFAIKNLIKKIENRLLGINQKYRSTLTKDNIEDLEALVTHFGIFNIFEIKSGTFKKELACYFECHKVLLAAGNALSQRSMVIDFTDMLYLPYVWKLFPVQKFGFLFIDECQDLSKAQFAVAAKYGKKGGRILAVGDPRQSIYGFTGADIDSFNRVKTYTKAKELPLTLCFRCPSSVIELAKEFREDIVGFKKEPGKVTSITIDKVSVMAKPNDLIICRIKAPLVILVFDFIDKNIKIQIHEDEAQEVINELRNIFKPEELNARISSLYGGFERLKSTVLKRWEWIIQKKSQKIRDATERNLFIKNETEYLEKRLEFFHKKHLLWQAECPTIDNILKKIKKYISATQNPIKLSSIHRAKGLEEDRVFIVDYDQLPYFRLDQQDWEKTQEINLKYVAVTRARKELFLVEAPVQNKQAEEGSLFDEFPF